MNLNVTVAGFVVLALIQGGVMGHSADFDVKQFRANAASVVLDMTNYLNLLRPFIMAKLNDLPVFADHAESIVEQFFETLPDYTAACHLGSAEPNYSVQKFLTDLSDNFSAIAKYYDELKRKNDESLKTESKCLSEHVVDFVLKNKDFAQVVLKLRKAFGRIRDEL
ncbi:uncharacterized protein LOC111254480 [Varroa destructor]|uniref:Uncharacterized protein n=1 Tax=Varroa destructor TaxID=109461 RepID=A0A7M7KS20_VARDE|nr:uncharacterized protein LOC111254480 [Varroa destructor]XP_022671104.1 uncharacterized protein LOC111254480 [Varroa destructor]